MRPILFVILLFFLLACSKKPQEHSSITLIVDGRTALSDRAEGEELTNFNSKYDHLINTVKAFCDEHKSAADLRTLLENEYQMYSTADITLEDETVISPQKMLSKISTFTVSIQPGQASCADTLSN